MKFKKISVVFFAVVAFITFLSLSFAGNMMGGKSHMSKGKINRGSMGTKGSKGMNSGSRMGRNNPISSVQTDSQDGVDTRSNGSHMGNVSNMHNGSGQGNADHHSGDMTTHMQENMGTGNMMGESDSYMGGGQEMSGHYGEGSSMHSDQGGDGNNSGSGMKNSGHMGSGAGMESGIQMGQ